MLKDTENSHGLKEPTWQTKNSDTDMSDLKKKYSNDISNKILKDSWNLENQHDIDIWIRDKEILDFIHSRVKQILKSVPEEVDDMCQDVIIRIITKKQQFSWDKNMFKRWVKTITRSMCIDLFRKQKNQSEHINSDYNDIAISLVADNNDNQFDILKKQDIHNMLMEALESLSVVQKEVMILRFFKELSYNEIVTSKNMNLNTVKINIHGAVKNLRKNENIINDLKDILRQ